MNILVKDITTVDFGVIAHGCNCSDGFGTGVAGAIKKKWPVVAERYHELMAGGNLSLLGSCQLVELDPDRLYIANCFTQKFYGYNGGKFADIKAIMSSLEKAFRFADFYCLPLYMPKIGCGRGGLKWEDIQPLINQMAEKYRHETFICEVKE